MKVGLAEITAQHGALCHDPGKNFMSRDFTNPHQAGSEQMRAEKRKPEDGIFPKESGSLKPKFSHGRHFTAGFPFYLFGW